LNEGQYRLEAPGRQARNAVDFPRIGDQLVDQDQAWPAGVEQLAQRIGSRRHTLAVGIAHQIVELEPAGLLGELCADLAPKCADRDALEVRRPPLWGR